MRSSALRSNLISVCIVGPEISQGKPSYHADSAAEPRGSDVVLAIQWQVTHRAPEKVPNAWECSHGTSSSKE